MTGKFLFCLGLLALCALCAAPAASALKVINADAAPAVQNASGSQKALTSMKQEVVNIVIDKIENGYIYAKDGRKFQLNSSTKIISNKGSSRNVRTAELTLQNGYLVTAIIK